jgi:hypothetical protein
LSLHDRTGTAPHLAVLRSDVHSADAGHLLAGDLALAAALARAVTRPIVCYYRCVNLAPGDVMNFTQAIAAGFSNYVNFSD